MTGCDAWHDALADRLAHDEASARERLDEHLEHCVDCRAELHALETIAAMLRRLGRPARNDAESGRNGADGCCSTTASRSGSRRSRPR
jgi:predicted anti-sigma-YlaC factor YlaD